MSKPKYLGGEVLAHGVVKKQYLPKKRLLFNAMDIYSNKKWGAVAKIQAISDPFLSMPKKKRNNLYKTDEDDKPLDTSKWVKPDEESIQNELIKQLFLAEIYREETPEWIEANAKCEVLFGILHSHWKTNPQEITMFGNTNDQPPFETILNEFKISHAYNQWQKIVQIGKWPIRKKKAFRTKWIKRCSKNMIRVM